MNVSQPAASRQIQTLETELGVRLFHRVGRTLQLTAEGEDILHQSRRLLADADLLTERARALKGGQTGMLRVAATPHVIATLLAQFLPNYRRHHPDVEVLLMEGGAARQPSRLERGEVHLAIMPVGPAPAIKTGFKSSLMFVLQPLLSEEHFRFQTRRLVLPLNFTGLQNRTGNLLLTYRQIIGLLL